MSVIQNFEVDQGTTIRHKFHFYEGDVNTPYDITGYDFRMMIRSSISGDVLIDCTPYMTHDPSNAGTLILEIPDAVSSAVEPLPANRTDDVIEGVYDLEAVNTASQKVTRPYRGTFNFVREVTRDGD